MINRTLQCPHCGGAVTEYKTPTPTADIIIEIPTPDGAPGIVLIERKYEPYGWALPGGFMEYGETLETTARREAKEETDLVITGLHQLHTFSNPSRDPRKHTLTTVFVAQATGTPVGGDDAAKARIFPIDQLPKDLVFDHNEILEYYLRSRS
jgi:8-oxo-dGTP diphosphatase